MYLDFGPHLTPETTPDDLPLTRLQPIRDRRNRPHIIRIREQDELFVDKVVDRDLVRIVVQEGSGLETNKRNEIQLLVTCISERQRKEKYTPSTASTTPSARPPSSY